MTFLVVLFTEDLEARKFRLTTQSSELLSGPPHPVIGTNNTTNFLSQGKK